MIQSSIELFEEAEKQGQGFQISHGRFVADTGPRRGRSAKERYILRHGDSAGQVHWGGPNVAIEPVDAEALFTALQSRLEKKVYTYEGWAGLHPVRVRSTSPWHISFSRNMFRQEPVQSKSEAPRKEKPIELMHDPYVNPNNFGLNFEGGVAILLDLEARRIAICGTSYGGEVKKAIFTTCNYLLPAEGILSMHASANCFEDGSHTTVLFGLSGTGKTTLSADPQRWLIGDDEILWTDSGISNLEGGCYAKMIDLDPSRETEIYEAIQKPHTILENVVYDRLADKVIFEDRSKTENTRASYPMVSVPRIARQESECDSPEAIVFLTADAFGALPAVSRLSPEQARYHFISGYTAKVAGTEQGIQEPEATFSACFGGPFMPRHPSVYGKMLADKADKAGASFWLLNTGWTGGGYGVGKRFDIKVSRALLTAIQDGTLATQEFDIHPIFGFEVPRTCPGIDLAVLAAPTGEAVEKLGKMFAENIKHFAAGMDPKVLAEGGPS